MQQIEFDLLLNFNQKKSTLFMADRNRLNTARQEKELLVAIFVRIKRSKTTVLPLQKGVKIKKDIYILETLEGSYIRDPLLFSSKNAF